MLNEVAVPACTHCSQVCARSLLLHTDSAFQCFAGTILLGHHQGIAGYCCVETENSSMTNLTVSTNWISLAKLSVDNELAFGR